MVHPYSKKLLRFLEHVHQAKSYAGVSALERSTGASSGLRTVFRWHRELGKELVYFPEVRFSLLGLCHAHLFIEEPSAGMFKFPYAVEYSWLVPALGERVLYLHCLLPVGDRESFGFLLKGLQDGGYCRSFSFFCTEDGWQALQGLQSGFDSVGHITLQKQIEPSWGVLEGYGKGFEALKELPLLIPVIFEQYGARLSLNQVWKRVYGRVGQGIWAYFPKRQRKWTVNGKVYVKKALLQLSERGLFLQNRVVFKPLLKKAFEVFLAVRVEGRERLELLASHLSQVGICVHFYPGNDGKSLVRVIGDADLLYKLFELFPEGLGASVQAYVLDREETWKRQEEVRFAWELLYDVEKNAWVIPREKILRYMGVEGYRG